VEPLRALRACAAEQAAPASAKMHTVRSFGMLSQTRTTMACQRLDTATVSSQYSEKLKVDEKFERQWYPTNNEKSELKSMRKDFCLETQ
jgi:hypothetical protein